MKLDISSTAWPFPAPFAKIWSPDLDNDEIPKDCAYVHELRLCNSSNDGLRLFFQPYIGDTNSSNLDLLLRFCSEVHVEDLHLQDKASIWIDDRNHAAHVQELIRVNQSHQRSDDLESIDITLSDSRLMSSSTSEDRAYSADEPRVTSLATGLSTSNRYSPPHRHYDVPLTAWIAYLKLQEKVNHFLHWILVQLPMNWSSKCDKMSDDV